MKRQITLAVMFLFIIAGVVTGCKKEVGEDRPLKKKITGKWQIEKREVTTAGAAPEITIGTATDYVDFKDNADDQVEINVGTAHALGGYVVFVDNTFNISISGKLLKCVVNNISDNKFEFTGTRDGTNPAETEKYTLTR